MLTTTSTTTDRHAVNVLLDTSDTICDTPRPFQPPVAQRDVKAEVAHCVGGVASPVLSNIYLNRLDTFIETVLIPEYTRGTSRAPNPAYQTVANAIRRARRNGDRSAVRELRKQLRSLPAGDQHDPGFRRLHYARYADDQLLGFTGPKAEAEEIKTRLTQFLHDDLKLELNQDKTLITHARTGAAKFLGYEITVQHADAKVRNGRRSVNGTIALRVPLEVIKVKCAPYLKFGKPERVTPLVNLDDHTIISTYGARYRGLVNYYLLAGDVWRLNRLQWAMQTSLLKTLACKYNSTVCKMAARRVIRNSPAQAFADLHLIVSKVLISARRV